MSEAWKPTGVDWQAGGHTGMVRFGEDQNLLVMFYNRSVPVPALGHVNGRPIHRDEIYIKIQQPGEMLNIIDRPVKDEDKQRFRSQWANFIHDRTQVPEGSPIELLFPNHPSVGENLRAMGVFTIEQCAALSAHAIDTIGRGAQEYKNRAQKYLDQAQKGVNFHKMQQENDQLKQKMRVQESQIELLKRQLDNLSIKVTDPVRASMQPPFVPNHDVQVDRINHNSPHKEIASRRAPPKQKTVEDNITDPLAKMKSDVKVEDSISDDA